MNFLRRLVRTSIATVVLTALFGLVVVLVLYPIITMLVQIFIVEGQLGLDAVRQALNEPRLGEVILNTAIFTGLSALAAFVVAALFAWLAERTNIGWVGVMRILPILPLFVPPIAGAIGWVFLLAPNAGFINVLIRWLTGSELQRGPLDIYSLWGMILVSVIYMVPVGYLVISAGLRNLDSSMEEASRVSGAGPVRTLWGVTLPLVTPALAGAAFIIGIFSLGLFSVPVVIGTGAGIDVLTVRIYRLVHGLYPPRTDVALVLGIFLLAVVQIGLLLQWLATRSGRFGAIGGRSTYQSRIDLGAWRGVARTGVGLYLGGAIVLPLLGLAIVSLQNYWTPNIDLGQLSFRNYREALFDNIRTAQSIRNSFLISAAGATIGILLAAAMSYGSQRMLVRWRGVISWVAALPASVPHVVIGLAFLVAFSQGPIVLYGTASLLLLAYVIIYLPQSMTTANGALQQIGTDLEEAARIGGATQIRTFRTIIFPLMLPGLLAGWVILFVLMIFELNASSLLSTTGNRVVGAEILNIWEEAHFPILAAFSLTITLLGTIVIATMQLISVKLRRW